MAEAPSGFAPGGLMHGCRATYSRDTTNLLKTMMQESKLTNIQQRQIDKAVKEGRTLPATVQQSKASQPRAKPRQQPVQGKVLNPRNYSSHLRQKGDIAASGAYDREQFHPTPLTKFGGKYEKDKQRLANMMAYGEDVEPSSRPRPRTEEEPSSEERLPIDRFTELQQEVEERRQFLAEMQQLGRAAKYQTIINAEISQLVREMELIDRRENAALERRLREEHQQ